MPKKFLLKTSPGRESASLLAPEAMYMQRKGLRSVNLLLFVASVLHAPLSLAQTPDFPKFEVASIKPSAPNQPGTSINTSPGRLAVANMPLKELMIVAWKVQPFQILGGPGWIESDHWDIAAKPESRATDGNIPLMLQALLRDRFHLEYHWESRELPVYALVAAKNDGKLGPGLTPATEGSCTQADASKLSSAPVHAPPSGCRGFGMGYRTIRGTAMPIADVVPLLSRLLGRTVIDKTGLTGKFDINLEWTPDESQAMQPSPDAPKPPPSDNPGPSLFTAIQEQLGLKLQSQKGPVSVIVIDRLEKPTEN